MFFPQPRSYRTPSSPGPDGEDKHGEIQLPSSSAGSTKLLLMERVSSEKLSPEEEVILPTASRISHIHLGGRWEGDLVRQNDLPWVALKTWWSFVVWQTGRASWLKTLVGLGGWCWAQKT